MSLELCRYLCMFFFFFKQKTAYELRISDWSSDVCSSDLPSRRSGRRSFRLSLSISATAGCVGFIYTSPARTARAMIRLFKHYVPNAVLLLGLLDIILLLAAAELGWVIRAHQIDMAVEPRVHRLPQIASSPARLPLGMDAGVRGDSCGERGSE